jgi:hypothetical protein
VRTVSLQHQQSGARCADTVSSCLITHALAIRVCEVFVYTMRVLGCVQVCAIPPLNSSATTPTVLTRQNFATGSTTVATCRTNFCAVSLRRVHYMDIDITWISIYIYIYIYGALPLTSNNRCQWRSAQSLVLAVVHEVERLETVNQYYGINHLRCLREQPVKCTLNGAQGNTPCRMSITLFARCFLNYNESLHDWRQSNIRGLELYQRGFLGLF